MENMLEWTQNSLLLLFILTNMFLFHCFSLAELTKSNEVLCNRITYFINEFQDFNLKQTLCSKLKLDNDIRSWPMKNLMFHNGKVTDWNGKWRDISFRFKLLLSRPSIYFLLFAVRLRLCREMFLFIYCNTFLIF